MALFAVLFNSQQDWHDKTLCFNCEEMPGHQTEASAHSRHLILSRTSAFNVYPVSSGNHSIIL